MPPDLKMFVHFFFAHPLVDIKISLEHIDSWAKSLLFRTHHLWNSTTELISMFITGQTFKKACPPIQRTERLYRNSQNWWPKEAARKMGNVSSLFLLSSKWGTKITGLGQRISFEYFSYLTLFCPPDSHCSILSLKCTSKTCTYW